MQKKAKNPLQVRIADNNSPRNWNNEQLSCLTRYFYSTRLVKARLSFSLMLVSTNIYDDLFQQIKWIRTQK